MKGIETGCLENLDRWIDIDEQIDMADVFSMQGLEREDIFLITKEKLKEIKTETKQKLLLDHETPRRKKLSEQLKIEKLKEIIRTLTENDLLDVWIDDQHVGSKYIFSITKRIENAIGETIILLKKDKKPKKNIFRILRLVECYNNRNYSFEIEQEITNEEETAEILKNAKKYVAEIKKKARKQETSSHSLERLKRIERSKTALDFTLEEAEFTFAKDIYLKDGKIFTKLDLFTTGPTHIDGIKEALLTEQR